MASSLIGPMLRYVSDSEATIWLEADASCAVEVLGHRSETFQATAATTRSSPSPTSAMIFDDHDVHDDWNTSAAWVYRMRSREWWPERIAGALAAYWIYQHLGNLSPSELQRDPLLARVRSAQDAGPLPTRAAASRSRRRRQRP